MAIAVWNGVFEVNVSCMHTYTKRDVLFSLDITIKNWKHPGGTFIISVIT